MKKASFPPPSDPGHCRLGEDISRDSLLFPCDGRFLVMADFHNHSRLSDGAGHPEDAFSSMRQAGLDIGALTDHVQYGASDLSRETAKKEKAAWAKTAALAREALAPGNFVALVGFEWSHPTLGHINVWQPRAWLDEEFWEDGADSRLASFYRWLAQSGAVASFNHPGRQPGRFSSFRHFPDAHGQMAAFEIFNGAEDHLFCGWRGLFSSSPLLGALDAGWHPGLIGTSDEHGPAWSLPGKGRTGLWVRALSAEGVMEALLERRVFATRLPALRMDVSANGIPMGKTLAPGPIVFAVDFDAPGWRGASLEIQVLGKKEKEIAALWREPFVPSSRSAPFSFLLPEEKTLGQKWLVLKVADPRQRDDGPPGHPASLLALAYASPFWLDEKSAVR